MQRIPIGTNRRITTLDFSGDVPICVDASDAESGLRGYDLTLVQDGITRTSTLTDSLSPLVGVHGLGFGMYTWEVRAKDRVNNMTVRTATFTRMSMHWVANA
jgi:hypothetical protein